MVTRSKLLKRWVGRERLLALIADHFEAFVTADRNLVFQQNHRKFKVGIFVLHAASNRYSDLKPLVPELLRLLDLEGSEHPRIVHVVK
jgi:hypothetical protein